MSIPDSPFSAAHFLLPAAVALSAYLLHRRAAFLMWSVAWVLLTALPLIDDPVRSVWPGVILAAITAGLFALGSGTWETDEEGARPVPTLVALTVLALVLAAGLEAIDRRGAPGTAAAVGALAAGWIVAGWLLFRRARWEAPIGAAITSLGFIVLGGMLPPDWLSDGSLPSPVGASTRLVAGAVVTVGMIVLAAELARAGGWRATDLENLLEEDPNMICVVRDGAIVFANRALRERSGRTLSELRDKDPLRFLSTSERREEVEIDFFDHRGAEVPVLVHAHAIEWRGSPAWRYELVDISERREAEREVQEMMRELQRMNAELEYSHRRQTDFLSNTTHELKTPLTSIIANTEILEYEMCGPVNEEQRRVLTSISSNSQRLLGMITRLLAFASQHEEGDKLRLQEAAVRMLVENVLETVRPMLEEGDLTVELDLDDDLPACTLDPEKIYRVYLNLVENAIKFSSRGVVRVGAHMKDGELEGSVTDQGIGIPPDMLEEVFQPFRQVDAGSNRSYGGVGLGLAICKHLVELHGGRIWAESTGESGAAIRFRVPCDGIPRDPAAASGDSADAA